MRDMYQIGHNGTFVTEDYIREMQIAGFKREERRTNLMMRFGCGGTIVGAVSLGTIVVGSLMFLDGHVKGDVAEINNGKTVAEVGAAGLAVSLTSIGISIRIGNSPR